VQILALLYRRPGFGLAAFARFSAAPSFAGRLLRLGRLGWVGVRFAAGIRFFGFIFQNRFPFINIRNNPMYFRAVLPTQEFGN
jgi:hypothetical protein